MPMQFYRDQALTTPIEKVFVPSSGSFTFFIKNESVFDSKLTLFFYGTDASNVEMSFDEGPFQLSSVPFSKFFLPGEILRVDLRTIQDQDGIAPDMGFLTSVFDIVLLYRDGFDFKLLPGDVLFSEVFDFTVGIGDVLFRDSMDFTDRDITRIFRDRLDFMIQGNSLFGDRADFIVTGDSLYRNRLDFRSVGGPLLDSEGLNFTDSGLVLGDDLLNEFQQISLLASENFDFFLPPP